MPSSVSDNSILPAPPPWKLEGTVYTFLTYTSSKAAGCLKSNKAFMYSPLEADSSFASGKFLGGIGMVQVIRYTDTPVGPYDELVVVPGSFGYRRETASGNRKIMKEEKNQRATRVYVSQKQTCWNGRKNWSIPKHLARFSFKTLPGNGISIAVFPHDEPISESRSSSWPIFKAIYQPISYLPSFPISTVLAKFVGVDVRLAQPPLPQGREGAEELVGTDKWHRITPYEFSWRASLGWWDLKQGHATEEDPLLATPDDREVIESPENFWPGVGRWRIGMLMENAIIEFPEGEEWGGQES